MKSKVSITLIDVTESVKQIYRQVNAPLIGDTIFEIKLYNATIGQVCISEGAVDNFALIDWIELFDSYHGMHLLRAVLEKICEELSKEKLYFDADIDLVPKYLSVGAHVTANGYDTFREMVEMVYERGCEQATKEERRHFLIVYNDAAVDKNDILYREFCGSKVNADEYAKVCTARIQDTGSGFEGPCRSIPKASK